MKNNNLTKYTGCISAPGITMKKSKFDDKKARAAFLRNFLWTEQGVKNAYTMLGNNPEYKNKINQVIKLLNDGYLTVGFTNGTQSQKEWVKNTITKNFKPLMDLNIIFSDENDVIPMIIINITSKPNYRGAAFSAVGTQSLLNTLQGKASMELGWLDQNQENSGGYAIGSGAVVVHEFGHAIGLIHEHQSPKVNIKWNESYIYDSLKRERNWDREMVYNNIINQYESNQINASEYDSKSVMHYKLPDSYFIGANPVKNMNSYLSNMDKKWIIKHYKQYKNDTEYSDKNNNENKQINDNIVDNKNKKIIIGILVLLLILLILFILFR